MKQIDTGPLQREIVQVFGHPVLSFSDCTRLAEAIYDKTGLKISVNTLRRFFELIKAKYPPSYNTLNILAKACGYQGYTEFEQLWKDKAKRTDVGDAALLKYMVSLFQQMPVPNMQDETYINIVHLTIAYLLSNQDIIDGFQKKIARTKNGQDFYFEHFVHIDALAGFYGNGLRYYLNEKKDAAAQVFGHSLLCFRSWLTLDDAGLDSHYRQLRQYALHLALPHIIQGRYVAAQLFHAHIHREPVESILEEARRFFQQFAHSKENLKNFPHFELEVVGALVLTGQFEEALYYLNQVGKKRAKYIVTDEVKPLFKGFDVYELLAWTALGKKAKAEALYQQLQKATFYFLTQKYFSLLLLQAERLLNKRKFRGEKLDFLIRETGFERFRPLFEIREKDVIRSMDI